jgi:hypothetical protein
VDVPGQEGARGSDSKRRSRHGRTTAALRAHAGAASRIRSVSAVS